MQRFVISLCWQRINRRHTYSARNSRNLSSRPRSRQATPPATVIRAKSYVAVLQSNFLSIYYWISLHHLNSDYMFRDSWDGINVGSWRDSRLRWRAGYRNRLKLEDGMKPSINRLTVFFSLKKEDTRYKRLLKIIISDASYINGFRVNYLFLITIKTSRPEPYSDDFGSSLLKAKINISRRSKVSVVMSFDKFWIWVIIFLGNVTLKVFFFSGIFNKNYFIHQFSEFFFCG